MNVCLSNVTSYHETLSNESPFKETLFNKSASNERRSKKSTYNHCVNIINVDPRRVHPMNVCLSNVK